MLGLLERRRKSNLIGPESGLCHKKNLPQKNLPQIDFDRDGSVVREKRVKFESKSRAEGLWKPWWPYNCPYLAEKEGEWSAY